jgi:hypothetical protein
VEVNPRILPQELAHQSGFVSREILKNDVNLFVPGAQRDDFLEDSDKVTTGMTSGTLAVDPTCGVSMAAYKDNVP